jgi:hypothetical protein
VPDAAAGEAQRQAKVYREIFQLVKTAMLAKAGESDTVEDDEGENESIHP